MRERVRIVQAVRIAGVGRLLVGERRRHAVDRDRRTVMSGPGVAAVLEMLFLRSKSRLNSDQALRRLLRELDVVARQELVGDRVVDREDVGVQRLVAAVAELRPDACCPARTSVRAPGLQAGACEACACRAAAVPFCTSNACVASLPCSGSPPLILRSAALVAQPSSPLSAPPCGVQADDVVGALLQARRHLDVDAGSSCAPCAATSTVALPISAPPVPRRISAHADRRRWRRCRSRW